MEKVTTEEKQEIIQKTIKQWKKEYIEYRSWVNLYTSVLFIPFVIASIWLFYVDDIVAILCSIFTIIYFCTAIIPSIEEWNRIKKCNLNNIHNIKVGVIFRKYYRQRTFSIFLNRTVRT